MTISTNENFSIPLMGIMRSNTLISQVKKLEHDYKNLENYQVSNLRGLCRMFSQSLLYWVRLFHKHNFNCTYSRNIFDSLQNLTLEPKVKSYWTNPSNQTNSNLTYLLIPFLTGNEILIAESSIEDLSTLKKLKRKH